MAYLPSQPCSSAVFAGAGAVILANSRLISAFQRSGQIRHSVVAALIANWLLVRSTAVGCEPAGADHATLSSACRLAEPSALMIRLIFHRRTRQRSCCAATWRMLPWADDARQPWIFRTYAGHSTAADSNRLFRTNLAKGQTGLPVAFDLPTQTGYDSDHALARGEVGKVGVPIVASRRHADPVRGHSARQHEHLDDDQRHRGLAARALCCGGRRAGVAARRRSPAPPRTTSSRNISRAAPMCSRRSRRCGSSPTRSPSLCRELPKWNPINVCSYHLQEAGATPVQELGFALATAIAVLDARARRAARSRR